MELLAGVTLGLPVVLAGGAAVVMGTAAALSVRAGTRPELPATRWHRPLPPTAAAAIDRVVTPAALRATGVVVVAVLLGTLATTDGPVRGGVLVAAVVLVSLLVGPLLGPPDPGAGAHAPPATDDQTPAPAVGWPAVRWLAGLSLALLVIDDGRALAVILAGYGLVQVALRRRGATECVRREAVAALVVVVGHVAPLERLDDGRLAWRNPVVSAAHAASGPATVWLTAVVAALALTGGATALWTLAPPGVLLLFAVVAVAAGMVLRAGVIRPFFIGALAPLAAAYGLQAGGRWLAPIDLLVFVALHAVAVAVLHRQAIARHDPRTARAVQFPARLAIVTSVLAGLAVFTAA